MARPRPPKTCCSWKCLRQIQPEEKAVAVTLFAQTMGMGKRRTSKSERLYLCPQCAMRVANPEREPPPSAPVDVAYYRIMLDLAGGEPDVIQATFEQLAQRRQKVLYPPELPEGEILPPETRRLKAG